MVPVHAGASQLIGALYDELGIGKQIDAALKWDRMQWKVSPGTHMKAMVMNVLCGRRPLYLMEEFYQGLDVEQLFGPGIQAADFNDDALGRTLDRVHEAGSWKLYSSLALSTLRKLEMPLDTIHSDTTSFTVYGDYEDQKSLAITHGYSKDKRPDLKQIVIGMGVTPQRIPVLAGAENGNLDDKTWNRAFIKRLREVLADEEWEGLTYVADSALATEESFRMMKEKGLPFITRLPDTFGLATELKEEASFKGNWEAIGALGEGKEPAEYKLQSFTDRLYGQELHFVVVHSSHLEERGVAAAHKQIEKEAQAIQKPLKQLEGERYSCQQDAERSKAAFLKQAKQKWKWHACQLEVVEEEYVLPRAEKGRPKAGEVRETGRRWRIATEIALSEETVLGKSQQLGMFIIVSSHAESEAWSAEKILRTYKGQSAAETRFRLLKDPVYLDAIYLKQPQRVEALCIVVVMALLLYGVLEWRVRERLKQESEPLLLPGKRKSHAPTGEMLLALLQTIQLTLLRSGRQTRRMLSPKIGENVKRVVELAGYSMDIYTAANGVEAGSN